MKKQSIPVEVKDLFEYNPVTGIIIWKKHPRLKGKIAGCVNTHGGIVLQFTLKGKRLRFQANRVIWYLHTNEDPGDLCVDHINRNRSDNRWENLRLVTHQQNSFNKVYKGYHKNRNGWEVHIREKVGDSKSITLFYKYFKTEEEASNAYQEQVKLLRTDYVPA